MHSDFEWQEYRDRKCGECLLVWAWRQVVVGQGDCSLLARRCRDAGWQDADNVFAALCEFLYALGVARRRKLVVGPVGDMCRTADERRMLALLSALQHQQPALRKAHLCWLVRPAGRARVLRSARRLVRAMAHRELSLPVASGVQPAGPAAGATRAGGAPRDASGNAGAVDDPRAACAQVGQFVRV